MLYQYDNTILRVEGLVMTMCSSHGTSRVQSAHITTKEAAAHLANARTIYKHGLHGQQNERLVRQLDTQYQAIALKHCCTRAIGLYSVALSD